MLGYRSDPSTKKLLIDMAMESIQTTVAEINRLSPRTREWVSLSVGKKHTAKP